MQYINDKICDRDLEEERKQEKKKNIYHLNIYCISQKKRVEAMFYLCFSSLATSLASLHNIYPK